MKSYRLQLFGAILALVTLMMGCALLPAPSGEATPFITVTPLPAEESTATTAPVEASPTPPPAPSTEEIGLVTNVVDGDTIDVNLNGQTYRVRYILVNTPETKHPTLGVEPFGPEAFAANKALVEGKTVTLEKDVSPTDKYGRLLRYVYVDNLLVNEELLRLGLAQVDIYPPDLKYLDRFRAVQQQARDAGVGMWANFLENTVLITGRDVVNEYVDIQNTGNTEQTIAGWTLLSERGGQKCGLNGVLAPQQTLRIWARVIDADKGGYNCGFKTGIWSNDLLDPAVLLDANGYEVARLE